MDQILGQGPAAGNDVAVAVGGAVRPPSAQSVPASRRPGGEVIRSASMGSMGGMSMAHPGGASHMSMSVGGMSMTGHGATDILPSWLAVLWTLVFIAVLVIHARHVADSTGQRRVWHSGHVVMAAGMIVMYAPASIDSFHIPSGFWQILFADGVLAIVAWMLAQALGRRPVNVLWLMMAVDFGAMAYMWSPTGFQAPITWIFVAYFVWQGVMWASDRIRTLDHRALWGGSASITPGGAVAISTAEPLVCFKDLRLSMLAMTLGMAYMLAAMQLMM